MDIFSLTKLDVVNSITGADLGLFAGGSQSVVVICHSTYEPGGGDDTCVVLLTDRLLLASC